MVKQSNPWQKHKEAALRGSASLRAELRGKNTTANETEKWGQETNKAGPGKG